VPTYDFTCKACGTVFEAMAAPGGTAPCVKCGSEDVERVWGPIAPMPKIGLRGAEARRAEARRQDKKERRRESREGG
jgi:putative FmdB family regulatory protein